VRIARQISREGSSYIRRAGIFHSYALFMVERLLDLLVLFLELTTLRFEGFPSFGDLFFDLCVKNKQEDDS